jgi:hypothetical protein
VVVRPKLNIASVVDEDPDSPTCGDVVIHGERFAVISPCGRAEHPYSADFNLDIKDALKGRANYEIRWKKIFKSCKAEHKAEMARKAEQLEAMHKILGMTGHQRQTMRARLDNLQYSQRQQFRATARPEMLRNRRAEPEIAVEEAQEPHTVPFSGSPPSSEVAVRQLKTAWSSLGELALRISPVMAGDFDSILTASWLHGELFVKVEDHGTEQAAPCSRAKASPRPSDEAQEAALTFQWLHDELFPITEPEPTSDDAAPAAVIVTEALVSITTRRVYATVLEAERRKTG